MSPKVENAIRTHLSAGNGILKVAALVGCGSGTVQRVKREMGENWRRRRDRRSSRPLTPHLDNHQLADICPDNLASVISTIGCADRTTARRIAMADDPVTAGRPIARPFGRLNLLATVWNDLPAFAAASEMARLFNPHSYESGRLSPAGSSVNNSWGCDTPRNA